MMARALVILMMAIQPTLFAWSACARGAAVAPWASESRCCADNCGCGADACPCSLQAPDREAPPVPTPAPAPEPTRLALWLPAIAVDLTPLRREVPDWRAPRSEHTRRVQGGCVQAAYCIWHT